MIFGIASKSLVGLSVAALGLTACATYSRLDPPAAQLAAEDATCRNMVGSPGVESRRVCATRTAWADYDKAQLAAGNGAEAKVITPSTWALSPRSDNYGHTR